MARKLLQVGLLLSLLLGSWAGALAACPHVGCRTTAARPDSDDNSDARPRHHAGQPDHSGHAAPHDAAHTPHEATPRRGVAANRHDSTCTHCAGSRGPAPSRAFKWQVNNFETGRVLDAPRAVEQVSLTVCLFVREFVPTQHAPPGGSERHLLLNVFRI